MKEIGKEWEKMDRLQQTRQFFKSYKIEIWKRRVFIMTTRRPRCTYTGEFKDQLVQLYINGKRKCDIIRKYDIAFST